MERCKRRTFVCFRGSSSCPQVRRIGQESGVRIWLIPDEFGALGILEFAVPEGSLFLTDDQGTVILTRDNWRRRQRWKFTILTSVRRIGCLDVGIQFRTDLHFIVVRVHICMRALYPRCLNFPLQKVKGKSIPFCWGMKTVVLSLTIKFLILRVVIIRKIKFYNRVLVNTARRYITIN